MESNAPRRSHTICLGLWCGDFGVGFTMLASATLTVIAHIAINPDLPFTKIALCVSPLAVLVGFCTGIWLWKRIEQEYQDQKRRNETIA